MTDELTFKMGDKMYVTRKGDENEKEWWWAKRENGSSSEAAGAADGGYIPRNLLGLHPRVTPSSEKEHQSTPNSSSDMEVEEEHSSSEKADFQTDAELARGNECEDADNVKMSSP